MNVSALTPRLPSSHTFGADPLVAARRSGAPLDQAEPEPSVDDGQAQAEALVEEAMATKARQDAARRQTKEFEMNVRRADVVNAIARARAHDGRNLCSAHDASVMWQMEALLHTITGVKTSAPEPIAEEPDASRPINSHVDRAIHGGPDPFHADLLLAVRTLAKDVVDLRREWSGSPPAAATPVSTEPQGTA